MKRICFILLTLALALSAALCVSAQGEERIILYENFEKITSLDEIKEWYGIKDKNTIAFSVKDGQLVLDNTGEGAVESYFVIVQDAVMKPHLKEAYTICYDVILDDVGEDTSKYANLIYNYDEYDNYNSVHLRWRGNGNNQVRFGGSWYTFDSADNKGLYLPADDENAFIKTVFGLDYLPDTNHVGGKTMSVRLAIDPKSGCTVYLNDVKVSEMADDTWWNINEDYGAIAIKVRPGVLARMDNILVYTGDETVTPGEPVHPEYIEPETSSPTAETTAAPETTGTPDTTGRETETGAETTGRETETGTETTGRETETSANADTTGGASTTVPGESSSGDAAKEEGGSKTGIIVGIIAAIVVAGAIIWYIVASMNKKK